MPCPHKKENVIGSSPVTPAELKKQTAVVEVGKTSGAAGAVGACGVGGGAPCVEYAAETAELTLPTTFSAAD
jgi:hypothetical protein